MEYLILHDFWGCPNTVEKLGVCLKFWNIKILGICTNHNHSDSLTVSLTVQTDLCTRQNLLALLKCLPCVTWPHHNEILILLSKLGKMNYTPNSCNNPKLICFTKEQQHGITFCFLFARPQKYSSLKLPKMSTMKQHPISSQRSQ